MWTDEQLSAAKYVVSNDYESRQDLNIGTIEISGANQGIYLMRPVPPFGSLSDGNNSVEGMKFGVVVPQAQLITTFNPRGTPVPATAVADQFVIHDYGKPTL